MLYAFDLDGTLIDSYEAVLASYREVGVDPPKDFFTRPWRDWLKDEKAHDKKNKVYLTKIHTIKQLPLMQLYRDLASFAINRGLETPWILTGASKEATAAITQYFGLLPEHTISEMSVAAKIHTMNIAPRPGIMFEDQAAIATRMRSETRWTICHTTL